MKVLLLTSIFGILNIACGFKVSDWSRDWGNGTVTLESAQLHSDDKRIVHTALGGLVDDNVPAISLHDFSFSKRPFQNGIVAIRPLMSTGNQICLIYLEDMGLNPAVSQLNKRHGTTIGKQELKPMILQRALKGGLNPLSFPILADFCGVDRKHIYYIKDVDNIPTNFKTTLKIQGLFHRYHIAIANRLVDEVIGSD